jgi:hypothetical protein
LSKFKRVVALLLIAMLNSCFNKIIHAYARYWS